MFIALAVPEIFFGSPMTQWTSKGYEVFFRNDLFEEDMILIKLIRAIHFLDNLKSRLVLIIGHSCVTNDLMDLNGSTRNI